MYIDAKLIKEKVYVCERDKDGNRHIKTHFAPYDFYYKADNGKHTSIYGDKLTRVRSDTRRKHKAALGTYKETGHSIFESEINPVFRLLEERYPNDADTPELHIGVIDIEVDKDPARGWSSINDPYAAITAISTLDKHTGIQITLAVPPHTLTMEEARTLLDDPSDEFGALTEDEFVFLCKDEEELLLTFLDVIEPIDVLTGWNCIPVSQSVWGSNAISPICDIGDKLYDSVVLNTSGITKKEQVDIELVTGHVISTSLEHKLPVRRCPPDRFTKLTHNSKNSEYLISVDMTVKNMIVCKDEMFLQIPLRDNKNDPVVGITNDQLYMCGLIYTDGTLRTPHNSSYRIYQSDIPMLEALPIKTSGINGGAKGNYNVSVKRQAVSDYGHSLIYDDAGNKRINLHELSKLSNAQFNYFLAGLIDGDGWYTPKTDSINFCCYRESDLKAISNLCFWNGYMHTMAKQKGVVRTLKLTHLRVSDLPVLKQKRWGQVRGEQSRLLRNNSEKAKLTRFKMIDGVAFIRVNSVTPTGELVDMMDIETDTHYYVTNGVRSHNSKFYDMPYIIHRIRMTLGGESSEAFAYEFGDWERPCTPSKESEVHLLKLGLFPTLPKLSMVERYGKSEKVYELNGRIHLDYLELYRKFTFEELHSYKLDFVLQKEIGENKLEYDGTLDELYRNDFKRFVAYNIQDVAGLSKLDDKLKMIELANSMVHMAGVTFDKVTGSVAIIQQAILRRLHKKNRICFDKNRIAIELSPEEELRAPSTPGAYVYLPTAGVYPWITSYDINSLYPSLIRALNISPEVIVGQFKIPKTLERYNAILDKLLAGKKTTSAQVVQKAKAAAWGNFVGVLEYHDIINETDDLLELEIEGTDDTVIKTAKEWNEIIREEGWTLTAYGTVLHNDEQGIVAECLEIWYNERVTLQKKKKKYGKLKMEETDPVKKKEYDDLFAYYDQVQMVRKIFLNSTYGAFLAGSFLFYDKRLGASVTLSGRVVTTGMIAEAEHLIENIE